MKRSTTIRRGLTIAYVIIIAFFVMVSLHTAFAGTQDPPVKVTGQDPVTTTDGKYTLLAPIPGVNEIDTSAGIGNYLSIIFKIGIGLCGAIAVMLLVLNGIKYMTSESFTEKAQAKKDFGTPILGLLIALSAWVLLNTIDPALTGVSGVKVDTVEVNIIEENSPEGGDISEYIAPDQKSIPPASGIGCSETGKAFCMHGTYDSPKPTEQIPQMIALLKSDPGYKINQIDVYTNDRIFFSVSKGSDKKSFSTTGLGHGSKGFSQNGGSEGDHKTPIGSYKIIAKRKVSNQAEVIKSIPKGFAMGAAAFNLNYRGIDIHGNRKNTSGTTAACILMSNDDLLAIFPYMNNGIVVNIRS